MQVINTVEGKEMIDSRLGSEDFELIDVRSPLEYKQGHLKDSKLIPLEEIQDNLDYFKQGTTYLIYCRTGGRSGMAAQFLIQNKIIAINMMGGIVDWKEQGFDIEL